MTQEIALRREKRVHDLREKYNSMAALSHVAVLNRISNLPNEILAIILGELSPASRLSLALTCKIMLEAMREENGKNTKVLETQEHRYEFSKLISNDFVRHLLCHECKILHKRRVDEFSIVQNGGLYKLCDNTRAAFPAPCLHYALSYEMVDLVLRFDEVSSDHGLPCSLLAHRCEFNHEKGDQLRCRVEVTPRIREGRLLMRIDSYVEISDEKLILQKAVDTTSLPCMHMTPASLIDYCSRVFQRERRDRDPGRMWHGMDRCGWCVTDASIKVIFSTEGEPAGLLIRAWKDFGKRGRYFEQPWKGHVATNAPSQAMYISKGMHLGFVFDGPDAETFDYNQLADVYDEFQGEEVKSV